MPRRRVPKARASIGTAAWVAERERKRRERERERWWRENRPPPEPAT